VRLRPDGYGAVIQGAALVFILAYVDAAWEGVVLTATVLIGPFLTALFADERRTGAVAAFAVLSAVLSGGYNDNYGTRDYFVRLLVVIAGAAFAVTAARTRRRLAADQAHFALLRGAAEIADSVVSIPEVVERVGNLLVPSFADVCVIDVLSGGRVERLGVVASRPDAEAIEDRLRRRDPGTPEDMQTGAPLLAEHVDEAHLRANARDEDDYQFLRSLAERSHIRVPLRSRGSSIGTLSLLAITRSYSAADLQLAQLLAGRVGLALDNAGMFAELESAQVQLTTALDSLAEAITIQNEHGTLVYANDAAGAALGFESGAQLIATPLREITDAYTSFHEDGTPLRMDRLPGRQVLEGRTPEPMLVRAVHKRTGDERWRIVKATAVPVREGEPRLAVNVIEDVTEVKRAELAQRFLAEASAVLASALDYEETLKRIAELAVPRLADWCGVTMPDEGEHLRSVAVAHSDPDKVAFARAYEERYPTHPTSPTGSAQVLRDGSSQLINGITDELLDASIADPEQRAALASVGMRAVMMVPMVAGGRGIGVISMISAESGRAFAQADLELAEELGRRAGTAVENARLYRERSHIAATLQRGLLPEELPPIPGLRLASLYRPAGEENLVGGDFYDAFPTASGWMLLVGDVTGRGAEAAALTGQARHTLRTAGMLLAEPLAALEQLNQALAQRAELTPCTVALVHLAPDARTASIICAGHPQPLLVRGGQVRAVGHFGPMLGAWVDSRWRVDRVDLLPGDVLVLFSDGVTDTVGAEERFGESRLFTTLRGVKDAEEAVAAIDAALNHFQRGAQADDTAVLALDLPSGA
jgi:PAS domain S-box-containing protein